MCGPWPKFGGNRLSESRENRNWKFEKNTNWLKKRRCAIFMLDKTFYVFGRRGSCNTSLDSSRRDLSTTHWKFFDLMHRLATNRAFVPKNVKKRIKFLQRSACHTKTPDGIFSKVTFLKSAIFPESLHRRKWKRSISSFLDNRPSLGVLLCQNAKCALFWGPPCGNEGG